MIFSPTLVREVTVANIVQNAFVTGDVEPSPTISDLRNIAAQIEQTDDPAERERLSRLAFVLSGTPRDTSAVSSRGQGVAEALRRKIEWQAYAGTLTDDAFSARQKRKTGRELQALETGYRNGALSLQQVSSAYEQLLTSSPEIITDPRFAAQMGFAKELRTAVRQREQQFQQQYGLKGQYNPRTGMVEIDPVPPAVEALHHARRRAKLDELREPLEARREHVKLMGEIAEKTQDPKHMRRFAEELFGLANSVWELQQAAGSQAAPTAPVEPFPGAPAASSATTPSFDTRAALSAAWDAGQVGPGVVRLEGKLQQLTPDGRAIPIERTTAISAQRDVPAFRWPDAAWTAPF